jgi:hypothetical protein
MADTISVQLQAKLRKARDSFMKAEAAESNSVVNRKVADGNYTAKLVGLEFAEFGKHPIIRFTYEVTDADKKTQESAIGQLVETRFTLDTDEGPSFIKRDFGRFGYDDVNDLLDDPVASNELFIQLIKLNPICKIAVAMDDTDQWQNVYLNDVLEMDDEIEEVVVPPKKVVKEVVKEMPARATKTKTAVKPEPVEEVEPDIESGEGSESEEEEDEEDDEPTEDGERELEVGDIVEVNYKGKDSAATVVSIDEASSTVKVQIGNKRMIVPLESIYLLEG